MSQPLYVLGVDYGTDSVRTILVNTMNGDIVNTSVVAYPRWSQGKYCDPATNQYRQHPQDYIDAMQQSIKNCLQGIDATIVSNIKGLSVDTTGSTPVAVNAQGVPLALLPEFAENPNAMFILWKDHTSAPEADEINQHAAQFETNYLQFVGGIYSSEWFWAKLLHVLRVDKKLAPHIYSWVEHCDWIPFLLTGETDVLKMKRGVCSAGHKALWAEDFGGLPPESFFTSLDPLLLGFRDRLFTHTYTSATAAGTISSQWATTLGLPNDVVIGVGAFDAHMGAVGGQIEPYYLSKVMGTSTCDILIAPQEEMQGKLVAGICGQVNGSVIPGMVGLEAGQSAFGDIYAWYKNILAWPLKNILTQSSFVDEKVAKKLAEEVEEKIISELNAAAEKLPVQLHDELAVDWMNGRRTPDANQKLKGAIFGLMLGTNAPLIYKSLVEATCFGAKAIVERFVTEGIPIKGLIGLGGVAKKSPYIMQMMADVMNMPIKIHKSEQTCALGAAMFAATAAGIYPKVEDAMQAMGQGFEKTYLPHPELVPIYQSRYQKYLANGNYIVSSLTK